MKKIFAIALAVVMVLSIASVAAAFNWGPAASSGDSFGYGIDVIKYTRSTGEIGSSYFNADDAATAVNGADVYFAIKLTVPDLLATNDIRANAEVKIDATAISGFDGGTYDISDLGKGTYYYMEDAPGLADGFYLIDAFVANARWMNFVSETPVFARYCLDTDTAEVYAEVTSDRPLGRWFNVGNYDIGKVAVGIEAAVPAPVDFSDARAATIKNGNLSTSATMFIFPIPKVTVTGEEDVTVVFNLAGISVEYVAEGAAKDDTDGKVGYKANEIVPAIVEDLGAVDGTVTIDGVEFKVRASNDGTKVVFEEVGTGTGNDYVTIFDDITTPTFTYQALGTPATAGTTVVEFREANHPIGKGNLIAVIPLGGSDLALDVLGSKDELKAYKNAGLTAEYANETWAGTQAITNLMAWLDEGNSKTFRDAVAAREVYFTDSNMRTAFGFANKVSDSITWKANSTPIILDPTVSIPKTGDNASVIGFAMIMVAVVAAAVAVRKVNA